MQDTKLLKSRMWDPASISRGPDFYEFWDPSKKELYQQLSWLQETEWLGLDSSSSNGSAKSLQQTSWFSTTRIQPQKQNLEKTLCPSFKYTVVDGMEDEDTPKTITKAFKLKIKPTLQQKILLNQWSGCLRVTYNKTICQLTTPGNCHRTKISLQNRFVVNKDRKSHICNSFLEKRPWLKECPSSMRKYAVREAVANLKSCKTNKRSGNIESFSAPFKTKRKEASNGWCWSLEKMNVSVKKSKLFIFKSLLGEMKYVSTKQLKKLIEGNHPPSDCKILKDKYNDYYLVIPKNVKCQPRVKNITQVGSGDPGIRKFLTTYSPEQGSLMYGVRWVENIMPLSLLHDSLQSKLATQRGKERTKTHDKMVRLRKRIFNLKTEMHHKTASDLTNNFDLIMIPKLESGKLTLRRRRRLTTKTARALLTAGHCRFLEHLKMKCLERGKIFMQVSEHYTSKTCPCCGTLSTCNETFRCRSCNFVHDRDVVGALNIFLRSVRDEAPIKPLT